MPLRCYDRPRDRSSRPPGRRGRFSRPTATAGTGERVVQQVGQPTFGQGIVVSVVAALAVGALAIAAIGSRDRDGVPALATTNLVWWLFAVVVVIVAGGGAQYAERSAAMAAAAVG